MWRLIAKGTNALLGVSKLPLTQYPGFNYASLPAGADATAQLAPYYVDWLGHPNYDAYWKQRSIEEHFSDIRVPALHIGGWYDIFLNGTLRNYVGIKAHGGSDAARNGQHLLVQIGGTQASGTASAMSHSVMKRSDSLRRMSCLCPAVVIIAGRDHWADSRT